MAYSETVLVFPTNNTGTYAKGVAFLALQSYKARRGVVNDFCGNAYALSTRDAKNSPLDLRELRINIDKFLGCARAFPEWKFKVPSFPSHSIEDLGPMFNMAPTNVILPKKYKPYIFDHEDREWWTA